MSNEEALQILSERDRIGVNIINANDAETTKYNNDSVEALSMAVKALEKQIPQKPTIENGFVKCPACELYIRFPIMDRYNNCPECGQKILWKGDTE